MNVKAESENIWKMTHKNKILQKYLVQTAITYFSYIQTYTLRPLITLDKAKDRRLS